MTSFPPSSLNDGIGANAKPLVTQVVEHAEMDLQHGLQTARDKSEQLLAKVRIANDATVAYIKREPIKSVLLAAAAGAAIVSIISLFSRARI
ncbi:hypothetical protein RQP54_17160 [Curvibacter sp. APW13]|uniref:hypothetical protein n=1 Tax=Curvibacter sp. APW13 TaxID=3077236 RepID=UPI0028DD6354|nr:hypothetical protein [Curvibacter sp. APW13]MDT8992604.1 hypothetical protein [Curvibacter sp. APW13]